MGAMRRLALVIRSVCVHIVTRLIQTRKNKEISPMFGKKTSIVVSAAALLAIGAFGSAALAASAPHRGRAAEEARASAPVASADERQAHDYAWTNSKEPTYMAIQDESYRVNNGGY
jgi:hypothetical protein